MSIDSMCILPIRVTAAIAIRLIDASSPPNRCLALLSRLLSQVCMSKCSEQRLKIWEPYACFEKDNEVKRMSNAAFTFVNLRHKRCHGCPCTLHVHLIQSLVCQPTRQYTFHMYPLHDVVPCARRAFASFCPFPAQ